ncbi:psbP domain-containing protein 2, chloroplastic isoform X1 [Cucurbita moschata]|uniref:PsbP domain-containing protein 2, chloroplastic isoform X1 n=2 Tax=Cucurbita moschata TaxID=3662 RepID=A0A6J1G5H4_CUCMO|nr:psbP domain-containing protein 2, chloroplastic isoform X1 [Cucurbita moschata]
MATLLQFPSNILFFHTLQTQREDIVQSRQSWPVDAKGGRLISFYCSSMNFQAPYKFSNGSSSKQKLPTRFLRDKKLIFDADPPAQKDIDHSYHILEQSAHVTQKHILGSSHSCTSPLLYPSRRALNVSVISLFLYGFSPSICEAVFAEELELERYTDSKEGFTLLRPSSWVKVDKAGATVLFEEENKGSNNVGVVVNPVRLTSLGEFGTPQFVADKLIQAEKRKESTKDAAVVGAAERSGKGGLQVYEFEYMVDSTRGGMKRVFSAAFVASKKLYILNVSHSDKPESPLDSQRRKMLEQVLHSFDAAPSS